MITVSKSKALRVFSEVEYEFAGLLNRRVCYAGGMFDEFSNGIKLIWMRPDVDCRGCRFDRAWIDRDIDDADWIRVAPMLTMAKENKTYI